MKCNEGNFIKRLKKKKEDALEYVVERYLELVKKVTYKVLSPLNKEGAVEECMNDVFLAVWEHSNRFEGDEEDFKKWIYKIAKYQAIDYYRKLTRVKESLLAEGDILDKERQQGNSVEDEIFFNETKEEVLALIKTLEPTDQKIFTMKYFLDMPSDQIARQLGTSKTAVDNRVYRGKKKLNQNSMKHGWEVI